MKVTTTKASTQAGKTVYSVQELRFNHAWERVVNQQKENDSFLQEAQAFALDTRARIQGKEKAYMDAMHGACLHLISFFSRKSLTQWQRHTLMDWVVQYLQNMQNNPFGSHLDMEPIRQRLSEVLDATDQPSVQPMDDFAHDDYDEPLSDWEGFLSEDMFEELFEKFEQTHEQQRQDESQALRLLMKSSYVNRLFRKVAGVLHPDKERDEAARQDKNRLMGELIHARDTNNIPRIFSFYAEYVGQSPVQELGEDLASVTQILERQYVYLCDLKERILDEDPLTDALYRQFHRKTPAATQRAINKHLTETSTHTNALLALPQEVTSLKTLKPYLEAHYDRFLKDMAFDFM